MKPMRVILIPVILALFPGAQLPLHAQPASAFAIADIYLLDRRHASLSTTRRGCVRFRLAESSGASKHQAVAKRRSRRVAGVRRVGQAGRGVVATSWTGRFFRATISLLVARSGRFLFSPREPHLLDDFLRPRRPKPLGLFPEPASSAT